MTTSQRSINSQELGEYVQALKDYKKTGYKQSLSIIGMLKEIELTASQVNQVLPSAWLSAIQKIDPQDEEEQKLKNLMAEFLGGLDQRSKDQRSSKLSEMKGESKEKTLVKKNDNDDSEKENVSQNQMNLFKRDEKIAPPTEESHSSVSDEIKNFTVQTFASELVTDYKADPAAKKEMKPIAVEKAKQLEEAVEAKVEGDEDKFRLEARNVSSFLATKRNEDLRQGILSGQIDPKEFLENKEEFLSDEIKLKLNDKEQQALNDGNLNRDVEIVPESALHTCENCGSRKVEATEKQMKPGNHSSHSVLYCAECDHVELKDA